MHSDNVKFIFGLFMVKQESCSFSCETYIFSLFIFHFLVTEIRENYPVQHLFYFILLKGGPIIHRLFVLVLMFYQKVSLCFYTLYLLMET